MKGRQNGFTLIETILYLAIAASVIGLASVFFIFVHSSRVKSQVTMEIEEQGSLAMASMTRLIRNADAINSPALGEGAGSLSLDSYDAGSDPTIIESDGLAATVKLGSGGNLNLTNDKVRVSYLSFTNRGLAGTAGSIDILLTLEYVNQNGRSEYSYSKTFVGAATIR